MHVQPPLNRDAEQKILLGKPLRMYYAYQRDEQQNSALPPKKDKVSTTGDNERRKIVNVSVNLKDNFFLRFHVAKMGEKKCANGGNSPSFAREISVTMGTRESMASKRQLKVDLFSVSFWGLTRSKYRSLALFFLRHYGSE